MQIKSKQEIEAKTKSRDMELQVLLDVLDRNNPHHDFSVTDTILVRAQIENGVWICKGNYEAVDYGERLDDPANPHLCIVGARIHPDLTMVCAD